MLFKKLSLIFIIPMLLLISTCKKDISVDPVLTSTFKKDKSVDPEEINNNNIVLQFHFDENSGAEALNSSSNNLHGNILGASRVPGKLGNALKFDNLAARVEIEMPWIGNAETADIPFDKDQISCVAWIKLDSLQTFDIQHIIGDGYLGLKSFKLQINNGKIQFLLHDNSDWRVVITSTQILSYDNWIHVGITYDGSTAKIYINSKEDNTNNVSFSVPTAYNTIYIGSVTTGFSSGNIWGNQLFGAIDELFILNKIINQNEIQNYYNLIY